MKKNTIYTLLIFLLLTVQFSQAQDKGLLSKKLTELKIPHQFEQYNGDHRNRLWGLKGRIYNEVLPFIFDNLVK